MAVSKGIIVHNEWDFALQGLVRSSVVRELPSYSPSWILLQAGSYFIEAMGVSIHRRHDCLYIFLRHGLVICI